MTDHHELDFDHVAAGFMVLLFIDRSEGADVTPEAQTADL